MTEQPIEQPIAQRTNPPTRFLRLPEVQGRTGLSRSTIYVRLAQGRFPRPVSLGARAVGLVEAEVDGWIRERIAESRSEGAEAGASEEAAGTFGARQQAAEDGPVR